MKNSRKRFFGSVLSLMIILSVVYYFSASGLYNSSDTPQYFTIKSLIENNSVDISKYSDHEMYFVFPDIFFGEKGETFGVRGYLTSVFAIPLYVISSNEVALTGLFGVFTAVGIGFLFAALILLGIHRVLAFGLVLVTSFGTYAWKYANLISRHGVEVLLIGMCAYLIAKNPEKTNGVLLTAIWGITFGVDISLFIGMSIYMFIYLWCKVSVSWKIINICLWIVILGCQLTLNMTWYRQVSSFGTIKQPTILNLVGNNSTGVWFSTPWYPAIRSVLINSGKLKPDVFTNFDKLPREVAIFASVDYAKQYNFYGIFVVSPFLMFGFLSLFRLNAFFTRQKSVLYFIFTIFITGILFNAKVLNFWGGNQYDVRYFYPFAVALVIPTALFLRKLKGKKLFIVFPLFLLSVLNSLLFGWWGQLSMYKPNLTGERKVWLESPYKILNAQTDLKYLLQSTFTNINLNGYK